MSWGDKSWVDDSTPERIADPATAYADVRQAHGWATQALAESTQPAQVQALTEERKRLAGIAWRLKRRL